MEASSQLDSTSLFASLFTKSAVDLVKFAVNRFDLSITELVIVALVFAESTRPIREDQELASSFGQENQGLPNKYRFSVSLAFVHNALGLSRETARRKLGQLVERGWLVKVNGRYMFAEPKQGEDPTASLRAFLHLKLDELSVQSEPIWRDSARFQGSRIGTNNLSANA